MAKYSIGGQALIEGVMMRGPKKVAIAVRNASGTLVTEEWDNEVSKKPKVFKIPFIRGIFNFIDSMKIGYKTLMRSADIAMMYDEGDENNPDYKKQESNNSEANNLEANNSDVIEENKDSSVEQKSETNIAQENDVKKEHQEESKADEKEESSIIMNIIMTISSLLGVALSVALFIWLPTFLFNILKGIIPAINTRMCQSVFEGILKIIIFIVYVALCSMMEDMRRVFMYHGAEHKTIFCYENGLELTVDNVKKQTRFHPRCGTSFLALMLIVGIAVGLFIPHNIPTLLRAGIKILCVPIIMGIGYEAIKLAGRKNNLFVRIISAPGLWIQRITTKEPTDDMIECAITSFVAVLPKDEESTSERSEVE